MSKAQKTMITKISFPLAFKIIITIALLVHAFYLVAFFFIQEEILVSTNIFSIVFYMFAIKLLLDSDENGKLVAVLFQIEVLLHAMACIAVLGWGYGFELLFLVSTVMLFFTPFSYKRINYVLTTMQILASITFYVLFEDKEIKSYGNYKDFFFIFNLCMVSMFSIMVSYLLEISNSFVFLNILEQKENMKTIVNHDPLTGLLNRASIQDILQRQSLFENIDFAVVMCDIDDFKKINDTYGHSAGDEVLKSLSKIFKNTFRNDDYIARWGGEEFLVIIRNTKKIAAIGVVNRVRELLNENIVEFEGKKINATMTFGVITHDNMGEFDITKMIKQADELLYDGKRSGKNIVMSAEFNPAY
ncbi:MAG: GGDEF domain-containing protein [Campylobacter sp.]|nr:GGDEF domain-containing protein [Campylobacter sp.]